MKHGLFDIEDNIQSGQGAAQEVLNRPDAQNYTGWIFDDKRKLGMEVINNTIINKDVSIFVDDESKPIKQMFPDLVGIDTNVLVCDGVNVNDIVGRATVVKAVFEKCDLNNAQINVTLGPDVRRPSFPGYAQYMSGDYNEFTDSQVYIKGEDAKITKNCNITFNNGDYGSIRFPWYKKLPVLSGLKSNVNTIYIRSVRTFTKVKLKVLNDLFDGINAYDFVTAYSLSNKGFKPSDIKISHNAHPRLLLDMSGLPKLECIIINFGTCSMYLVKGEKLKKSKTVDLTVTGLPFMGTFKLDWYELSEGWWMGMVY